jgi:ArsR family transcriptional regulator
MKPMTPSTPAEPTCCADLTSVLIDADDADELAAAFKSLSDPVRLRLLSLIANSPGGEACACDLPAVLDRSQPTISHHLGQLQKARLIDREQRGKWAWFTVRSDRLADLRAALGSGSSSVGEVVQ